MNMKAMRIILVVLAVANLALGHWAMGLSLIAIAIATGRRH